jgi:VIT1/CCC1 family predicted Fe2+/Mn2+ transporter
MVLAFPLVRLDLVGLVVVVVVVGVEVGVVGVVVVVGVNNRRRYKLVRMLLDNREGTVLDYA